MDETKLAKLREIFLQHVGRENRISSGDLAKMININPGSSKAIIRGYIREVMKKFRLPIISDNKGYFIAKDPEELLSYWNQLESRKLEIDARKWRAIRYFSEYYGIDQEELLDQMFDFEEEEEDEDSIEGSLP